MTEVPADALLSEGGLYWWDGEVWRPAVGEPPVLWTGRDQVNPDEYPALSELLVSGGDVDAYLRSVGLDEDVFAEEERPEPMDMN